MPRQCAPTPVCTAEELRRMSQSAVTLQLCREQETSEWGVVGKAFFFFLSFRISMTACILQFLSKLESGQREDS